MATIKIGVDLGTSDTKIYSVGSGIVLNEPTVTALSQDGAGEIKAVGLEAKKLIGKTAENTKIVFPVFEGEVVNETLATEMLSRFLKKTKCKKNFSSTVAVFSVPCGMEEVQIKKLSRVAERAGIASSYFVEVPILSAIGMNIPLTESTPCFLIDMGGGTTNVAALSLDGVIAGISVSLGGKNIDTRLIDYIADAYGLQIGLLTAERIKTQIGSLYEADTLSTVVNGRDLETGRPRSIVLKAVDIFKPISEYYDKIFSIASSVLAKLPPEVSAEIRHAGIYISGGGASVAGLEEYYRKKFNMAINIAEEPSLSVVLGLGATVASTELLKKVSVNEI